MSNEISFSHYPLQQANCPPGYALANIGDEWFPLRLEAETLHFIALALVDNNRNRAAWALIGYADAAEAQHACEEDARLERSRKQWGRDAELEDRW